MTHPTLSRKGLAIEVNYCVNKHSKTSFEKNCFSAWASTLNMDIKPIFSVLAHAEKQFFSKLVFECLFNVLRQPIPYHAEPQEIHQGPTPGL